MTAPTTESASRDPVADWFGQARFGMFIHWGIYAVLGHGEQPLYRELLDQSEYRKLADRFTAESYDPQQWARLAKDAGMRYMVLTTRHHDGFCLFNTATTDYNAVRTAAGRDLVAEYIDACRAEGLRVGLYFSLPDWSEPAFFARPGRDPDGWDALMDKTFTQVRELLTQYGTIDLLWFDITQAFSATEWRSVELMEMVRSLQPNIVVNDRLPRPDGHPGWGYPTPEQMVGQNVGGPWESCFTSTRAFWGYHVCHEDPTMWRTRRELLDTFARVIAGGGNLLLNVGPYASGRLPEQYEQNVRWMGQWIARHEPAIFGTEPADFEFKYGGVMTKRDNALYLWFLYWPGESYSLPGFNETVRSAKLLGSGKPVQFTQEAHRVILHDLPKQPPEEVCTVIELTLDAPPTPHPWAALRLWNPDTMGLEEWARL